LLRIIEVITRGEWRIRGESRAAVGWRRASPVSRLDFHPGEGIGPIRIGMRPAEVIAVFDEPSVYERWMGGNLNDSLLFHGLVLTFTECDSSAPLPDSTLHHVIIHQREDAFLFDRPMTEWTKATILEELEAQGFAAETPAYGDVEVPGQLGMSFDDNGQLIWLETE
jgi:hypothetical protein